MLRKSQVTRRRRRIRVGTYGDNGAGADKIWAEDSGGAGQPLLLLHEGVGDSRMWDPVWPELTKTFRAIRYDVRGYGRSPLATEEYSLLGDLRTILDHFGIGRAHLAGCSMGGIAAVDLALAEPDRAASLVLLCPGISGYDYPAEPELDAQCEALAAAGDLDGIARLLLTMWGAAGDDPFVTDLMLSSLRATANEEQFLRPSEPALDRLGELRVPTVLMAGEKDYPPLAASNKLAAGRIPGCELIWMPGVDHYPTVRAPQLVTETILSHCRGSGS
jgi:pimeloyl-ACP methyl ester carboxylesterase